MEHFLFFILKLIFYIWANRNWIEKFPIQWSLIPFKIFFRVKYDSNDSKYPGIRSNSNLQQQQGL